MLGTISNLAGLWLALYLHLYLYLYICGLKSIR
jgi:hypothetical protein